MKKESADTVGQIAYSIAVILFFIGVVVGILSFTHYKSQSANNSPGAVLIGGDSNAPITTNVTVPKPPPTLEMNEISHSESNGIYKYTYSFVIYNPPADMNDVGMHYPAWADCHQDPSAYYRGFGVSVDRGASESYMGTMICTSDRAIATTSIFHL